MEESTLRVLVAEFVGTFTLIFIGGGAGIVSGQDIVAVALANGLAIGIMVSNLGHISGGHFNPAITLGFLSTRRIAPMRAGIYWVAQFGGAAFAAVLLRWFFHMPAMAASVPTLKSGFGAGRGMALEMVLTFFLVGTVFATAVDPRGSFKAVAGLTIGLIISIDVFVGGPITGAAVNPARAFGPELVSGHWSNAWIYYVGPALGGLIAAIAYEYLYLKRPQAAAASS
ncbi:MAG: aquaporin [Gaiellaceae bacterium]